MDQKTIGNSVKITKTPSYVGFKKTVFFSNSGIKHSKYDSRDFIYKAI